MNHWYGYSIVKDKGVWCVVIRRMGKQRHPKDRGQIVHRLTGTTHDAATHVALEWIAGQ